MFLYKYKKHSRLRVPFSNCFWSDLSRCVLQVCLVFVVEKRRDFFKHRLVIIVEPSLFFKYYVIELLQLDSFKLNSLDEVNFNASLDGNIRVIGSTHPKTNQEVYIKQGEFHDIDVDIDYYWDAMMYSDKIVRGAYKKYKEALEEIETKRLQYSNRLKTEDDLLDLDLRVVFSNIFPLHKVRSYGDTVWCCCPFHETATSNPSFCITPTHYFCASCGEKGNIFTLIKKGLVEQPKQEYWITQGAKQWLH